MKRWQILAGDCQGRLAELDDNSVDAVVTDPPYGLSFMGKGWDYDIPKTEAWVQCLRVLKPGGYLLCFAGTRTQHRMGVRIEDAGFEIRDMIAWVYGSGFPKSHNGEWGGTALKPALEPITVARKPLSGTVAENVLVWGTGGLRVDECRVPTDENLNGGAYAKERQASASEWAKSGSLHKTTGKQFIQPVGRWPANLIHDGGDEVLATFPEAPGQQGDLKETGRARMSLGRFGDMPPPRAHLARKDAGSAARFFYCAKAGKADRGAGNDHPTVKPTELMRYLCRLVTPEGGLVLDPFAGSGSTGKAAILEGLRFIGCELNPEYIKLAEQRIAAAEAEVLW